MSPREALRRAAARAREMHRKYPFTRTQTAAGQEAASWAIVELASHVHGCEELLSPLTRRTVSETRARLAREQAQEKR